MKLSNLYAISAGLALGVTAASPQKQVLITYPTDTPESALIQAKNSIESGGGQILHEFELLKGFIVKASEHAIESIHALSEEYKPLIEEDQTVTTQ
ncbi:MAG: hypothetical protein Q9191_006590 [Dirinaria sp. TL-2023a]